MGATYTRQSSYADGDVITAAHTNDEFNQLLAAFQASTGHTHDGTANEGGPITKMLGTSLTLGDGTAGTDITVTFDGETNDGVLKWMEDEDYFEFNDDILVASTEKLQFRDTALYINSSADGQLDIVADTEVQIAAPTIDINGDADVSGTLTYGSLSDGSITITAFVDEDNMASDSATLVPTQQSVKAYVDAQVTAQDLDFQADSGGALNIDLDSETLTFTGGTGIDTSGSGNAVTFAIDSTVTTLTDTQTLTNKTLTTPVISTISNTGTVTLPTATDTLVGRATTDTLTNKTIDVDNNTVSNIEVDNFKASAVVIESEGIGSNDNDTTLPTSAAVKDYVDSQVTAQDLDFQGDSGGALSIDLGSETLDIAGGTGIDTSGSGNTLTVAIDSTVATKAYVSTQVDLVNDTTPQLGGDLSTNSHDILFADNDVASFGSGGDLQIYHDSSNSYISERGTGNLYLGTNGNIELFKHLSTDRMAKFITDGAVELYYANSKKIETTTSGVTVTGTASATTFSGDLNGTINSATTATTQTSGTSNTLVATTAFAVTEANNSAVAMAIALG
jgi:hypothetical protein